MAGRVGKIRVGVGGWTYEPWRGPFYPEGLAHKRELEFASRKLTSIEINGTFYGSQKPESFAKWHDETPDGFVFALKGPRYATNRRALGEAGETIERFFKSGVMELKDKLGPINWQLMPTKKLDLQDVAGFLRLLPRSVEGRSIGHALEVRHESFRSPSSSPWRASTVSPSCSPATASIPRSPIPPRPSSMRASWAQRKARRPAMPGRSSTAGRSGPRSGRQAGYRTGCDGDAAIVGRGRPRRLSLRHRGHKVCNPAAAMALIERLGAATGVSPRTADHTPAPR